MFFELISNIELLSIFSSSDAVAGCENGKIYHVSLGNGRIVRKIGSQEEAGVNDLSAIGRNEIVSGNMAGQLLV